jgi:AhpD family alkylhydroperoxidase
MYEVKNLEKVKTLADLTSEAMEAFRSFELRSRVIPKKYKEIMALAVACTTQSSYRIHIHNQIARAFGGNR